MDISDGPAPSAPTTAHREFSDSLEQDLYFGIAHDQCTLELEYALELVDYLFDVTDNLTDITPRVIQKNPEIVLALRHIFRPKASQKRCEKYIGFSNLAPVESGKKSLPDAAAEKMYELVMSESCVFIVPWLHGGVPVTERRVSSSKKIIAAKIAQTLTEVDLRTTRKDIQEERVHSVLEAGGYTKVDGVTCITAPEDLERGQYVDETSVKSAGSQQADSVFRMENGTLGFIEAKAVGFAIDGKTRIKEFKHKADDWWEEFPDSEVFAVISGDVKESVVEFLYKNGIHVVWEHNLDNFGNEYALSSHEYTPVEHSNKELEHLPDDLHIRGRRNKDLDTYTPQDEHNTVDIGSASSHRQCDSPKSTTLTPRKLTDFQST